MQQINNTNQELDFEPRRVVMNDCRKLFSTEFAIILSCLRHFYPKFISTLDSHYPVDFVERDITIGLNQWFFAPNLPNRYFFF